MATSTAPTAPLPRRAEAPFAAAAAILFVIGVAGALGQGGVGGALEAAMGSPAPAAVACVLALLVGIGLGARVASSPMVRGARPLLVASTVLVGLAAIELLLPRAWPLLARAPLAARALAGAPLLLVPSIVTGALLPLVARGSLRDPRGSRRVSALFGAAFAGAAAGAALSATFAAGRGLPAATRGAALASALAATLALGASWRWPHTTKRAPPAPSRAAGPNPLAIAAVAHGMLGGAALLVLAHLVRVTTSSAADALPTTLAAVLAGLAAGAAQTRTMQLHYRETAAARAIAASGLMLAITAPLWGALPGALAVGGTFLRAPSDAALMHLIAATAATALPAAWIGASFQLLLPHLADDAVARSAARAAGAGAAGATLGAALAGVALVPWLGSQRALAAIALGFAALASGMAWRARARRSATLTALATLACLILAPRWDAARFAFGVAADGPAAWAREQVSSGIAAGSRQGALGVNGRAVDLGPDDRRAALLAALFAPRVGAALAADDLGAAAAFLREPWSRVTVPRVPRAWRDGLPHDLLAALDDPRAVSAEARGDDAIARAAAAPVDALVATLPPGAGAGAARALADAARGALETGGVAIFVLRAPEPVALAAIAEAVRARFTHAGLAIAGARALVLASAAAFVPPPGRLEALKDGAAKDALDSLIAVDDALDACADALLARGEASPAALRSCAGGAPPGGLVSR